MSKLAHSNDETMALIEASARADDRDEFTGHGQYCRGGAADCTCSPEYRENLAQIAEALMESTAQNCPGWHPADCPSEIVVDLVNERDDARATAAELLACADLAVGCIERELELILESHCLLNEALEPRRDTLDEDVRGEVETLEAQLAQVRAAISKATG